MDNNEFDFNFDFEKEFGLDGVQPLDSEYTDLDFDTDFLNEDNGDADFQLDPDLDAELNAALGLGSEQPEAEAAPEFPDPVPEAPAEEPAPEPAEEPQSTELKPVEEPGKPAPRKRRRKKTKQQIFKEVYLPAIITGAALILILIFIIGSISRGIQNSRDAKEASESASKAASEAAAKEAAEVQSILAEAELLAAGYDYEGAINKLDSFSGTLNNYSELVAKKSAYTQAMTQLVAWSDPSKITNLSFHVLIADPSRAFSDQTFGTSYNRNFVTTDEFSKILDQLYANGYVLVDFDSIVEEKVADDGSVTYAAKTIYLPEGKTPVMITETMVNYYSYMIGSNNTGTADVGGDGFASKLVLQNGEITAEMLDASGNTIYGDYDLVPILNHFIEAHPDFAYQGARATLAVSGYDGVFGYRTNMGNADEIAAAKELVQALRDEGYTIACYTYSDKNYSGFSATEIKSDLDKWAEEVTPVLGDVDIIIYAKGIDITDYSGARFNVMYEAGFRYFIGASTSTSAEVGTKYVIQKRLMVTGTQMANTPSTYSKFFDAASVLNTQRGAVPN